MRRLRDGEVRTLEERGCIAEDWARVLVADGFSPGKSFNRVFFSGDVRLGTYQGVLRTTDGFAFPAGIDHCSLHNATIGNDCLIHRSNLANVDVGDFVVFDNVGAMSRRGDSPFANASPVNVLAEDGARSVLLWRGLSSQIAHLLCHLKKHPVADALEAMIRRDAATLRLGRSVVLSGCRIRETGTLRNVWLGEGTLVEDAAFIEDCYVESSREAPARIGQGVSAKECVFLRGSETLDGARLEHCLVGEGVRIRNGFSGKHSLFFANSDFSMGEACSAMTGPFAVSGHKATLVLTCQSSFSTFGSASNSSNHHFKLGPLHGGVLRRGVKCGSGSYVFWPSDIGAFTTVVGRHAGHLDTVNFPFSLLIGKEDRSILIPGVNLFTSGCFRDAAKWRERDRRGAIEDPVDLVNPTIFSPYVFQAMAKGAQLLKRGAGMGVDLRHGGAVIPAERFEPAIRLYDAALTYHTGERMLAMATRAGVVPGLEDLIALARDDGGDPEAAMGKWRDWGGMLLPGTEAKRVMAGIESGELATPGALAERLHAVHAAYDRYEWSWLAWHWRRTYGEPGAEALAMFIDKWRRSVQLRHDCIVKDAGKEFTPEAMFGFGVEEDAETCFRRVRGDLSRLPLAARAEAERTRLLAMAERIPSP